MIRLVSSSLVFSSSWCMVYCVGCGLLKLIFGVVEMVVLFFMLKFVLGL